MNKFLKEPTPHLILAAINSIVEYNWNDEMADWEDNGKPLSHIYMDLVLIDAWLNGQL